MDECLSEYLRKAWELNRDFEPPGYGKKYRSPMWEFLRRAKAHPDLAGLDGFAALAAVENCLEQWDDVPEESDPWEELFPGSDDPRAEFVSTWPNIKWAKASLDVARESATRLPLKPFISYSPQYDRFIGVVGHLQRSVEGSILIPCRKFADLLGCTPMSISRYRKLAVADALLKMTANSPRAQRKADEFVFAVEKFEWATGIQIAGSPLSICVTSESECYTEIHETERNKEMQEIKEKKETKEMQRKTRVNLPKKSKCTIRQGPFIPTIDELKHALQETEHLRKATA